MILHAVIIDDELNGLKSLELLLDGAKDRVKLVGATTDALQGIEMINLYRPDLVFLDISMPELDGFEVLDRLSFNKFYLVFTTAHQQHALKALKRGAVDYLLKPVDRRELYAAIERIKIRMNEGKELPDVYEALRQFSEAKKMRVLLHAKKSTEYVNPSDIVYIEANLNNCMVSLINGQTVDVTSNLKEFESQLCTVGNDFMRIHHSFIINLNYVTRYVKEEGGFVSMRGKKSIPVSRQKKEQFLKWIDFQF